MGTSGRAGDPWVRAELLAADSDILAIPKGSTFEPLQAAPKFWPTGLHLPPGKNPPFSSHISLPLPCEHGSLASEKRPVPPGFVDDVHCFTLRPGLAGQLNASLQEFGLHKEALANAVLHEWGSRAENMNLSGGDWVDAWLVDGSKDTYEAGARRTNAGGYQSQKDVFQDKGEGGVECDRKWGCRLLRRICSEAMRELRPYDERMESQPGRSHDEPHDASILNASAWINVNRGSNFNSMHVHDTDRWSAVYFVADGFGVDDRGQPRSASRSAAASGQPNIGLKLGPDLGRHLVFRGGAQSLADAQAPQPAVGATTGADSASHCYLAVPPVCGTLWLFPGSIPHCVLGSEEVVGREPLDRSGEVRSGESGKAQPADEARISVAINIIDVVAPQPHASEASEHVSPCSSTVCEEYAGGRTMGASGVAHRRVQHAHSTKIPME